MIALTGADLTPEQLAAIIDHGDLIETSGSARERAAASRATVLEVLTRRAVYGRSTGVGANHAVAVSDDDAGRRLMRSHAGGAGPVVDAGAARATVVVRANQLLAGGSGVDPALIDALVAAANSGAYAQLHSYGAIGTGDLTAMAELALTVLGERPWIGDAPAPAFAIDNLDALALLSSSALMIAQSSLAYCELTRLADAATAIAALSLVAMGGSAQPFAAPVQAARPHAGSIAVAERMRSLLDAETSSSDRIQDPYGLRAFAPVHGVLIESLARLRAVLVIELNAAAENPLVSIEDGEVFHHGNFHQAPLAAALDAVRLGLLSSAQLGVARLAALMEPRLTGLRPFLADGPAGSSGLMIIEYTAASALADVRGAAAPVTGGNAVLSRGAEDHASFAPQAARQTRQAIEAYRVVLAAELVAAVRALRQAAREPASAQLAAVFATAAAALPAEMSDRPLEAELELAADLLPSIGGKFAV